MTFIQTYQGHALDYENPQADQIDILDIAHALSQVCRFSGQARFFYSVAQHSVLVAENCSRGYAFAGLMHDATEAYLGDIPGPAKFLCPDYEKLEQKIYAVIAERFNLAAYIPNAVKDVDVRMLQTERQFVFKHEMKWPSLDKKGIEPFPILIKEWRPDHAEAEFLEAFEKLRKAKL